MATSRRSLDRTPAYTIPKPPFPSTAPTLYASSKLIFLCCFTNFFTASSLILLLLHCSQEWTPTRLSVIVVHGVVEHISFVSNIHNVVFCNFRLVLRARPVSATARVCDCSCLR